MADNYSSEEKNIEFEEDQVLISLIPHQYPKRILYFFGFFVVLFLYSLAELPQQLLAMIDVKQGESKMAAGYYKEAAAHFQAAAQKTQSVEVHKNFVVACLKIRTPVSLQTALSELAYLNLNEKQKQQVQNAMPAEEELKRLLSEQPNINFHIQK